MLVFRTTRDIIRAADRLFIEEQATISFVDDGFISKMLADGRPS
jgi:hypothetical protein